MDLLRAALEERMNRPEASAYTWHMRVVLIYLRDELAMPFDQAWSRALMSLPRPEHGEAKAERERWGVQLQAHREVWRAAYERELRPLIDQAAVELELADLELPGELLAA